MVATCGIGWPGPAWSASVYINHSHLWNGDQSTNVSNCVQCSIPMQEPGEAILEFQTVLSERDNIDDLVAIYLLGSILNRTSNGQVVLPSEVGSREASSHVPFVSCAVETLICFC